MECLAHGKHSNKKVEGGGGLKSEISKTSDEGGSVLIPALPPTSSVTPEHLLTCRLASLVSAVNWGSLPRSVLVKVEVRIAKS